MRATITAIGSRADAHPYVALGKGRRAAGHDVTLAMYDRFVNRAQQNGLGFASVVEGALSRGAENERGRRGVDRCSELPPSLVGILETRRRPRRGVSLTVAARRPVPARSNVYATRFVPYDSRLPRSVAAFHRGGAGTTAGNVAGHRRAAVQQLCVR